jgi:hypothetical protein
MLRSSLVTCALLALLAPAAARAVPAFTASPADLEPNSVVTVELSVAIDSKDVVVVSGGAQALGATTLTGIQQLELKGGDTLLRDPHYLGFTLGDALEALPRGIFPFARVEVSTGGPGDHVVLKAGSFLLLGFSEGSLTDEVLIRVGGDVPPSQPPRAIERERPAPAGNVAPSEALTAAPTGESSPSESVLDRLFSPLGGLVLAAVIMVAVYLASTWLGRGSG